MNIMRVKFNKNKRMIGFFIELDIPKWHYSVSDAFYIVRSLLTRAFNHIMKKCKMKQILQALDVGLRFLQVTNLVKELGLGKWAIDCGRFFLSWLW